MRREWTTSSKKNEEEKQIAIVRATSYCYQFSISFGGCQHFLHSISCDNYY